MSAPHRRRCARTSNAGDSRMSATPRLYATPRARICAPLTLRRRRFNASAMSSTTYAGMPRLISSARWMKRAPLPVSRLLPGGEACGGGCCPADDLRDVSNFEGAIAGIDPLRREGQEEVLPHRGAARREERKEQLLGGARIGRALQDHQLAGSEPRRGRLCRRSDIGDVRIFRLPQRRRYANDDHIAIGQYVEIGRGDVAACLAQNRQLPAVHVRRMRTPRVERFDSGKIDVKADHGKSGAGQLDGQGEPYIALADDAHARSVLAQTFF